MEDLSAGIHDYKDLINVVVSWNNLIFRHVGAARISQSYFVRAHTLHILPLTPEYLYYIID